MARSRESKSDDDPSSAPKPEPDASYALLADLGNGPNPFLGENRGRLPRLPSWDAVRRAPAPLPSPIGDGEQVGKLERQEKFAGSTQEGKWRHVEVKTSGDPVSDARAIQSALIEAARSGEPAVIIVPPGTYKGKITFPNGARNIHLQAKEDATGRRPVFDMTGVRPSPEQPAVFYLRNNKNVSVDGFEIANFKSEDRDNPAIGILVEGTTGDIKIRGNVIHHLGIDRPHSPADLAGSEPISVRGTGATEATASRRIVITGNLLHDINLGQHEGITVNGNIDDFLIALNTVRNVNNIGIDVAGGYRLSANPGLDAARNGVVRGNHVSGIDTDQNRTYKRGDRSAGGIYVDGGWNVRVLNNVVEDTNRGIEIGCENSDHTARTIEVINNILRGNHFAAVTVGAGDSSHGKTDGVTIRRNLFHANGPDGKSGVDRQLYWVNVLESDNQYVDRSGRRIRVK